MNEVKRKLFYYELLLLHAQEILIDGFVWTRGYGETLEEMLDRVSEKQLNETIVEINSKVQSQENTFKNTES